MTFFHADVCRAHDLMAVVTLSQLNIFQDRLVALVVPWNRIHGVPSRASARHAFGCSSGIEMPVIRWEVKALEST